MKNERKKEQALRIFPNEWNNSPGSGCCGGGGGLEFEGSYNLTHGGRGGKDDTFLVSSCIKNV